MSTQIKCPKCHSLMKEIISKKGVALDICTSCQGIWLDEGEINFYLKSPKPLKIGIPKKSLSCPRCETLELYSASFEGTKLELETCQNCHGLFLDKGELLTLTKGDTLEEQPFSQKKIKPYLNPGLALKALPDLPSLGLVSLTVLSGLYAILFAILVALGEFGHLPPNWIMPLMTGIFFLHFFVSPFFTDYFLRFLGSLRWVELKDLPPHLEVFIKEACRKNRIPVPKIGIIDDDAPNAFTYGRTPKSARLVITKGILKILNEKEVESVVAHEIGHIVHWDFLFMTLAQLVPMILYQIYRFLQNSQKGKKSSSSGKKGAGAFIVLLICSYLAYRLSQYLVLYLSRIREYWADRFSGEATQNPNALSSALLKIAYGLSGQEQSDEEKKDAEGKRKTIGAFGISDLDSSKIYALYAAQGSSFKEAMQWDMWNPWAMFYEIHSTHPLTAKRINALALQCKVMGKEPELVFDLRQPESYWDDFFLDLLMLALPFIGVGLGVLLAWHFKMSYIRLPLLCFGLTWFLKIIYSYPRESELRYSISSLLKIVKVSDVRGIPVVITGKVIGRGIPGYVFSEDFVIQDKTGFIFLDYQQPLGLFNFLFAIFKRKSFDGQDVIVKGWYRRAPMPYVEVYEIVGTNGNRSICYSYMAQIASALILILVSAFFSFRGL